jgi:formylglycine-generating enzyme required for sulfatase activity
MSAAFVSHPLERGAAPDWASQWGEDRFGVFASFRVGEVRQRMRWIRPGRFLMGSPESEDGRFENEGPQHEVTLTRGFWLGETELTQALWEAVMETNPSRFQSPTRPVEQVSWNDVQEFLVRLEERVPGLAARLPTEAEWEYACRAGTTASTYAGELEILGENNGPRLDPIAWYGGNSRVEFELEAGYDSSDWPEKQYEHSRAGTHPVAGKAPNAWGLYDMLGNVYEWCEDGPRDYSAEAAVDPRGPAAGPGRVYRGGSWIGEARYARAAFRRVWHEQLARYGDLGFRLARGQGAPGSPS